MQVVIDINENVYKYLKQEWVKVPEDDSVINQIMHGILHGTVLPEGHGGLIDRDVACKELSDISHGDDLLRYVPTVIPADK